jgi:DNA-directed RNA polymerase subunit F
MIGKSVVGSRPATLVEVEGVMSKRLEEAEAEMKKLKKEKKVVEKPPEPPPEAAEGAEGAPAAPAPPEDKSPLGLEQRSALEYAKKFAKIGKRKAEELQEKLMKLDKMKPEAAAKITDIMPLNDDQVKLILSKEKISAGEKEIAEVMKIVESFRK